MPASPTSPEGATRLRQRLRQRRVREQTGPVCNAHPALVPIINTHDDLSPALERQLRSVAERAHNGDRQSRDALFIAFQPKLAGFIRRIHTPRTGSGLIAVWDRNDVEQEAWLVFDTLLRQWPPGQPFGRYVLANFPWRLRDAVYRGVARRGVPPRMTPVPIDDHDWLHDDSAGADEARALLNALADHLAGTRGTILRRHIGDGETLTAIARELGISRRMVTREWRAVREHLAAGAPDTSRQHRMA